MTERASLHLGSALADIFGDGGGSSSAAVRGAQGARSSQDPFGEEAVCAAAGPLSERDLREHTLCLHIAPEQVKSHGACPICMQNFEEQELVTTLRCFHLFHESCASRWLLQNGNCPVCRVAVKPAS